MEAAIEFATTKRISKALLNAGRPARLVPDFLAPEPEALVHLARGTVVIILHGEHAARRAVYLKTLASGHFLLTGPYTANGVPLTMIDKAFVQPTSTVVDISAVTADARITEAFFAQVDVAKPAKSEDDFFAKKVHEPTTTYTVSEEQRLQAQKDVDAGIVDAIKKVDLLAAYLETPFTLRKGEYPHNMKF